MAIIAVLKRKDASSVVVAVSIALILSQLIPSLTASLAGKISGLQDGQYMSYSYPGAGWKGTYLQPIVAALLQLIMLEIIIRLYIVIAAFFKQK